MSGYIIYIFICFILFGFVFSSILEYLNSKNWNDSIPDVLKDFYKKSDYKRAKNYKIDRDKVSLISSLLSTSITIMFIVSGFYGKISDYSIYYFDSLFLQSASFFLFFLIISTAISLPISYYSVFTIEEKYGFNKTTKITFLKDKIKGLLMSLIIGGFILFVSIQIYSLFGSDFWLWLWLFLSIFLILTNMFYTTLIVPIFNKLSPLEEGSLKNKIEEYSKKIGYSLDKIFVIDGSKRSSKANAFFSGLGPKKTIALFDTLIDKHEEDELVAVLAHEVGHYKKNHIKQGLLLSVLQVGIICYVLQLCLNEPSLSYALGASESSFHLGLIAFSFLFSPISIIIGIGMNVLSRRNEYEADNFAKESFNPESLKNALKKLSSDSLTNLYPHPLYVFVHYSHPPLLKRLEALDRK
ncbi:MAG: M48 family peptidase [Cryomorphaceae bacterium]|nr:MAG: M48 family peptidase [Cryomorphaceae bacterium]